MVIIPKEKWTYHTSTATPIHVRMTWFNSSDYRFALYSLMQKMSDERATQRSTIVVENPILEKVRSGASGQIALPAKKKMSEQMEVASAPTYASILKKGLKWAPVTVHSF